MPITLIIADDHALVREGLRKFVELEKDLKIVGEASTAEEALELVAKRKTANRGHGFEHAPNGRYRCHRRGDQVLPRG